MNPFIVEEAQARYQARLEAAAAWRLEQLARNATPSLSTRMRSAIGNALIVWGMHMKMQSVPAQASQ
jgi:hypothetical protein